MEVEDLRAIYDFPIVIQSFENPSHSLLVDYFSELN